MTSSISSSTVNDWSSALFSKLDTKKQGYIDKSDVESAFAKNATGTAGSAGSAGSAGTAAADKFFDQVDTDKDGKVSKSELSTAISKVADELNAQFDQSRVAKGGGNGGPPPGGGAGGPPPGGGAGDSGATDSTSSTSSSTYSAAADTNGDGTVSAEEAAAYAQLQAASSATSTVSDTSASSTTASASTGTASGASAGLSKDQLTERLNALDGSDSRHAGALKKLVDNFDKADTNGDGKLSRAESRAYLKSTREAGKGQANATDGADSTGTSPADALAKALELLKAYVNHSQDAPSSSSSTSSTISTQA